MPKLFLIVENKNDADVIAAIFRKRNIGLVIVARQPDKGGIARLAGELKRLIQTAIEQRETGDCIAVLHDADIQTGKNADVQKQISQICRDYQKDVMQVRAIDELESWILADSGICKWLEIRPENCDEQAKPSEKLDSLLKKNANMRGGYDLRGRRAVLKYLAGDGDKHSPSMREAAGKLTKTTQN